MLRGFMILVVYIVAAAASAVLIKFTCKPPKEVMRKLLHLIIVAAVFVYVYAFSKWYMSAAAAVMFAALAYPAVMIVERIPKLMEIFNERTAGEVRMSLLMIHAEFALLVCVFWGILGEDWKYMVIVSILAWGLGDAAAALVGKRWGKRKISHQWVDKNKTIEGSLAMLTVSAVTTAAAVGVLAGQPWYVAVVVALVTAPVCTLVEMISNGRVDTVTVPFSAAVVSFLVIRLFMLVGI